MANDRRNFLLGGAALAALAGAGGGGCRRDGRSSDAGGRGLLPPPGARQLAHFNQTCIRCMRCVAACPVGALRGADQGLLQRDLPTIDAQRQACILCMKCTDACPTTALTPLSSIAEMRQRGMSPGTAKIDPKACIKISGRCDCKLCSKVSHDCICRLCHDICPLQGHAITLDDKTLEPRINPRHCVGCGLCAQYCPERAIDVARRPDDGVRPGPRRRPKGAAS